MAITRPAPPIRVVDVEINDACGIDVTVYAPDMTGAATTVHLTREEARLLANELDDSVVTATSYATEAVQP